jgi:hypothetical protein
MGFGRMLKGIGRSTHEKKEFVPEGDLVKRRRKGQTVEPKELRELCELIRRRYSLDVQIWELRQTHLINRDVVLDLMHKSDATLKKINRIVDSWDTLEAFSNENDAVKYQEIRRRVKLDGKRDWSKSPLF